MPRSNSSVGSNGGGGGGMSNVTSVPGGTVPSSPTSVPGISATSAAAVAAAAAAANNSIADKTNYTLNALEQIRNSLQPYISNNSSERPMSSASGSGLKLNFVLFFLIYFVIFCLFSLDRCYQSVFVSSLTNVSVQCE